MSIDIGGVRLKQRQRWLQGDQVLLEDLIGDRIQQLDSETLLDLIYGEICLREEFDVESNPSQFRSRFPHVDSDIRTLLELHAALSGTIFSELPTSVSADDATEKATDGSRLLEDSSSIEVLQLHAAGGLGEIYEAKDGTFGRTVALKRVRTSRSNDPRVVEQFQKEAALTACLEHPGVVPIYKMVKLEDGSTGYTMRFVKGRTLRETIVRFHSRRKKSRLEAPRLSAELRRMLRSYMMACRTIAYAHSQGIVHRDIKPDNIILGDYGETVVVDWGLAERYIDGTLDTKKPSLVGTFEYMSPEQGLADSSSISPPADVFGLGAVLYCILTGEPPYSSRFGDLREQVQSARYKPPRDVVPDVPRPLQSICLRAMEADPAERYSTAGELAEEVERWFDDEPVMAHRASVIEQCARWSRKRQKPLLVLLSIAATAIIVLAGALRAVRLEQQRTLAASEQAVESAENAGRLVKLIAEFLLSADPVGLAGTGLPVPVDRYREELLTDRLQAGRASLADISLPLLKAELSTHYGNLYRSVGDYEQARELLHAAQRTFQDESPPPKPAYADLLHNLGWYEQDMGLYGRAEELYREALALRTETGDELAAATTKFHLAWSIAAQYDTKGRDALSEAEQLMREVYETRKNLLGPEHRLVAFAMMARSPILFSMNEPVNATIALTQGVAVFSKRGEVPPLASAVSSLMWAQFHRRGPAFLKNAEKAKAKYDAALAEAEQLLGDHPLTAMLLGDYAGFLAETGQVEQAEKMINQALDIGRNSLASGHPLMLRGLIDYGKHLERLGRRPEAEKLYQEAVDRGISHLGESHKFVQEATGLLSRK